MIAERPVTEYLRLMANTPAEGVFVLDVSTLDGADTLGAGSGVTRVDILPHLTGEMEVRRGARPDPVAPTLEVGTLSATVLNAPAGQLHPGQDISLELHDGRPIFTGRVTSASLAEFRDEQGRWHTHTTILAVDAVADLANVTRHGAVPDNAQGAESIEARVERLLGSVPGWIVPEVDAVGESEVSTTPRVVWAASSTAPASEAPNWTVYGGTITPTASELVFNLSSTDYAERSIADLVPGRMYALQLWSGGFYSGHRFSVDGGLIHQGDEAWLSPGLIFTPKRNVVTLRVHGESFGYRLTELRLVEYTSPAYMLAATNHETDLASYFDKTAASYPTARWWISAANRLRFSVYPVGFNYRFTDAPSGDSSDLHYADIERGYSTSDIVTEVSVTRHARQYDPENGSYVADDQVTITRDETLAASWGGRASDLETFAASTTDARALAAALIAHLGQPALRPRSLVWNAQENPDALPRLDVFATVLVRRSGVTSYLEIATITHRISARRHMFAVELIPS